jgi:hypothetical protein
MQEEVPEGKIETYIRYFKDNIKTGFFAIIYPYSLVQSATTFQYV